MLKAIPLLLLIFLASCQSPEEEQKSKITSFEIKTKLSNLQSDLIVPQARRALQEVGFFVVLAPGIDAGALKNAQAATEAFFQLDLTEKFNYISSEAYGPTSYIPEMGPAEEMLQLNPSSEKFWPGFTLPFQELFQVLKEQLGPYYAVMEKSIGRQLSLLTEAQKSANIFFKVIHFKKGAKKIICSIPYLGINLLMPAKTRNSSTFELKTRQGENLSVNVPPHGFIVQSQDLYERP